MFHNIGPRLLSLASNERSSLLDAVDDGWKRFYRRRPPEFFRSLWRSETGGLGACATTSQCHNKEQAAPSSRASSSRKTFCIEQKLRWEKTTFGSVEETPGLWMLKNWLYSSLVVWTNKLECFIQLGFSVSKVTDKKVQLNTDLLKPRHEYLYKKVKAWLKLNELIKMGNFNNEGKI